MIKQKTDDKHNGDGCEISQWLKCLAGRIKGGVTPGDLGAASAEGKEPVQKSPSDSTDTL